ncbi:MAG TPA: SpoIIE family protein phosphatase [Candidatus Acidoferrum sp.]|nr:SpoIIE family protein phosphatase [Candidatus Acidoferrum sp.]
MQVPRSVPFGVPRRTEPEAAQRLADGEARAQLILDTAPDAFVGIDSEKRIVIWNLQAAATFGWNADEAIGQTLFETIFPEQDRQANCGGVEGFFPRDQAAVMDHRLELCARHRDGRLIPVELTINGPLDGKGGQLFGAFVRDISQRKEREQELQQARQSAEARARTLEILNEISRELSALLNTDELLKRIGELLSRLLEYQTFSILLLDASGKTLKHRFSLSGGQVIEKPDIPLDRGLVGYAARYRHPVVVPDVREDSRYIKFHDETRSELSVPLIAKDKLVGVLDIENATPDYFREGHIQAITILASQLAVALDNAILYDRISSQEAQLNQDLRIARELQKRLLPSGGPAMKNAAVSTMSCAARIIAGDMVHLGYYRKQGLHVGMLGDVAGKGAAAALYAALTMGLIRSLTEHELSPGEMLKALNQSLMERAMEDRFVALCYTVWDDATLNFRIANSGLPKPVLFRRGKVEILEAVGMPLGLFGGVEFEEMRIAAEPGDVFLFLTDGILEAGNRADDEFGYEGVERALRATRTNGAREIREVLAETLRAHCGDVEARDDQTLLVLKVNEQV